ncbi:MAG TPA: DUF3108 domain-containing protein [Blastocatellia bacterium]
MTVVQQDAKPLAVGAGAPPSRITHPLPFSPGEVLTYDIGFSKFILSGIVGQLKLTVATVTDSSGQPAADQAKTPDPGRNGSKEPADGASSSAVPTASSSFSVKPPANLKFVAETVSKGFVTWLFDLRVDDKYQSIVDPDDLGLIQSTKFVEEGNKHRQLDTAIDRPSGSLTYTEKDLNNEKAGPSIKKVKSPGWIQDLLSAIYFLRTQELQQGKTLTVPVTDKGEIHNIDVVVDKPEQVEVEAGKFNAFPVEIKVFDGKYIRRSGQLIIWFTDDASRLPVRARVKSAGATATIKLTHIQAGVQK